MKNIILNTDSYKAGHFLQYPPGTEEVWSYIESRGGKWDNHLFFGLQMFLKDYLSKPITLEMIDEAEEFWTAHGVPFNRDGWMHILNKHGGHLPIEIEAVPEGTILPTKNVLVQLHNTDPEVPWLTSYIETALLRAVWYPTTVATNSWHIKQVIRKYLEETADDPDAEIGFKLHDFGSRGVSSWESAGIGGCAHLVNFMGTDTVTGALYARKYYGESMAGFSIPAAEHSTITAWGGPKFEIEAFDNMLNQFAKPGALVAVVSDSYDIYRAAKELWGGKLKQKVIDSGATIVVRPDSGDPTIVPMEVIEALMESFGYTLNSKGYRVLPSCIRAIQGDGVNIVSITQLLENMKQAGLSASNIGFGMGGALLQELNRDTLEFAMKACSIKVNGVYRDVYKEPVDGSKKSKRGRLALSFYNGEWETLRREDLRIVNRLELVFQNGKVMRSFAFKAIRERSNILREVYVMPMDSSGHLYSKTAG